MADRKIGVATPVTAADGSVTYTMNPTTGSTSAPATTAAASNDFEVIIGPDGYPIYQRIDAEPYKPLSGPEFLDQLGRTAVHGVVRGPAELVDLPWFAAQFAGKLLGLKTEKEYHSLAEDARRFLNENVVEEAKGEGFNKLQAFIGGGVGGGALAAGGKYLAKQVPKIPKYVTNFLGADDITMNAAAGAGAGLGAQNAAENGAGTLGQIGGGLAGGVVGAGMVGVGRGIGRQMTANPPPVADSVKKAEELLRLGAKPVDETARPRTQHNVPIMRSDLTEDKTAVQKWIQSFAAKNFLGTGESRLAQQKARQDAVDRIRGDYGVNENSLQDAATSTSRSRAFATQKLLNERERIVNTVEEYEAANPEVFTADLRYKKPGAIDAKVTKDTIDEAIKAYSDISEDVYSDVIRELQKYKKALEIESPSMAGGDKFLDFTQQLDDMLTNGTITGPLHQKFTDLNSHMLTAQGAAKNKALAEWRSEYSKLIDQLPDAEKNILKPLADAVPTTFGASGKVPKLTFEQLITLRNTLGSRVPDQKFGLPSGDLKKALEKTYRSVNEDIDAYLEGDLYIPPNVPGLSASNRAAILKDWKDVQTNIRSQIAEMDQKLFSRALEHGEADNPVFRTALLSTDQRVLDNIKRAITKVDASGKPIMDADGKPVLRPYALKRLKAVIVDDIFSKSNTSDTGTIMVNTKGGIEDKLKARAKQLKTFFTKEEIDALWGFYRLMRATKDAQEGLSLPATGVQNMGPASLLTAMGTGGGLGYLGGGGETAAAGVIAAASAPAIINMLEKPAVTKLLLTAAKANNKELANIRGLISRYLVKHPVSGQAVTTQPEKKGEPQ